MKKGQAAMEFLMTYGWAILVVLVAIGALAYFGVLSPARFLPEQCILAPGLDCSDHAITSGSATEPGAAQQVQIVVQNGMGDSVDFSSIYIDIDKDGTFNPANDCGVSDGDLVTPSNIPFDPTTAIGDGSNAQYTLDWCPAIASGRFTANIVGVYQTGSGAFDHNIEGSISGQAA